MRRLLFLFLPLLVLAQFGSNDIGGNWPIEVSLGTATRPTGVVAARGTSLFVATAGGQLWHVDVKSGNSKMINRGGDGQALAGLCSDERGEGTLYAGGRESGKLYAFDYTGKIVRIYQVTPPSTPEQPHFISDCIHSRYRLMITDSYQSAYIYFQVPDKGPNAGKPAPVNDEFALQGFLVQYRSFPTPPPTPPSSVPTPPRLGAYGIEWTGFYNDTAYVMHSSLGELYAFNVTTTTKTGALMVKVIIDGRRKTFPGALGILFDSMNERIMYICMPGANVIAVLEFHNEDRYQAKFIRFIKADLMNGPIMLGEYGDFIYPVSGQFNLSPEKRENSTYTLTKVSRHRQAIPPNGTIGQPFTVIYDSQPAKFPKGSLSARNVEKKILLPPPTTGVAALLPDEVRSTPTVNDTSSPSPSPLPDIGYMGISDTNGARASKKSRCFPASATVTLRDGTTRSMKAVEIGDVVLVDRNKYSRVYAFSHRDASITSEFMQLSFTNGRQLRLTPEHLVYLATGKLATASQLSLGTELVDASKISGIRRVFDTGLYNPQTTEGGIVVNGVRVSTFTSSIRPLAAHAALAPVRACQPLAVLVSGILAHGTSMW